MHNFDGEESCTNDVIFQMPVALIKAGGHFGGEVDNYVMT